MNKSNTIGIKKGYYKKIIISMIFYFISIFVNYLSAVGFINGNSQGEVSKSFPTMITPAPFAFSIWGLIYVSILASLIFLIIKKDKINMERLDSFFPVFCISSLINVAWTLVFAYRFIGLSAILILALLFSVIMILINLKKASRKKGIFDFAFGLYAGWLSIASVVNISAFLVSINFNFFHNEKVFYTVVLCLFIVVALLLLKFIENPFFPLSILWAFYGIMKRINVQDMKDPLFIVLVLGMVILVVADIVLLLKRKGRE